MDTLFLKILNMSINASFVVLAVILIRLLLQKAPKYIRIILWGLVAVRLICPFSIESVFGLIPSVEPISLKPSFANPLTNYNAIPVITPNISPALENKASTSFSPITITASDIWIIGMLILILLTGISYLRIRKKTREAMPIKDNIFLCDHIPTPFILGIIHPKIYLPSSMAEEDMEYVIAHENAHLKSYDHSLKPLGFLLLVIHWFNPFIWLAYILFCRDIELACDERVIAEIGIEKKKSYSNALINSSASSKIFSTCPLAFGEIGVKTRIKNILSYKKPALFISITAVIACVVVAVCFLTNSDGIKINQIKDSGGFDYLFKNVSSVKIVKDGYSIRVEDVDTTLKYLKRVKLEPTPISASRALSRDSSYQIVINDLTTICFNQGLNEIWINDNVKPTQTYAVKNPLSVQEIFKNSTSYSNSIKYSIPHNNNSTTSNDKLNKDSSNNSNTTNNNTSNTDTSSSGIAFQYDTTGINPTDLYVECNNGYLSGISIVSNKKFTGIEILTAPDSIIHWHPDGNSEAGAEIDFCEYENVSPVGIATISITYKSEKLIKENGKETTIATYDVELLNNDDLYLQQGTDEHEGIIFITNRPVAEKVNHIEINLFT